jgi:hypothetical protein
VSVTEVLRRDNRDLLAGIEEMRRAADRIGSVRADVSMAETCRLLQYVEERIIPRGRLAGQYLYPAVGRLLGSTESTRIMARDHFEVANLARQLARATEEGDSVEMRRLLYALYHVLTLHLAKEEEVYLPVLDERMTADEGSELVLLLQPAEGRL